MKSAIFKKGYCRCPSLLADSKPSIPQSFHSSIPPSFHPSIPPSLHPQVSSLVDPTSLLSCTSSSRCQAAPPPLPSLLQGVSHHWTLRCFRMQRFEECRDLRMQRFEGFFPISSQDPKDFWAETSVEGWTFQSKIFSCDFLGDFAKKCSKSRYNLPTKVVATIKWSNLNMTRHFEPKKSRSLEKESLAEIVASCSKLLFCKVTRETTQKGPTSNVKFYPLHLSQAKKLLDPGLI